MIQGSRQRAWRISRRPLLKWATFRRGVSGVYLYQGVAMNTLPESGFLRLKQIIGDRKRGIPPLIPVSASTWWAGVRSGRFPQGFHLSKRCTLWRVEDIRTLIQATGTAKAVP